MTRSPGSKDEGHVDRATTDADSGTLAATVAITLPVLLMLALASAAEAQVARVGGLFTEVEPELSANASLETLSSPSLLPNAAETPGVPTIHSRLVRVALDQLAAARAAATAVDVEGGSGAALALNLFDDVVLSAIVERATPTASGTGYALSGRIDGGEEPRELGAMTLLVYGETLAGTVSASAGTFTIQPVGDGVHAISQVDTSALPPPGEPLLPPLPAADPPAASTEDTEGVSEIDVAVFYTPAAQTGAATLSGIAGIIGLVDLMFENANAAYARSGVMQRVRLVRLQEVAYTESEDSGTDLDRLTFRNDGFMDEVHGIRDEYGADLVHLISDAKDVCGIAWRGPSESHGFGLTGYNCEIGGYTFAHELGHNMGLSHDRYAVRCSGQEYGRPTTCRNAIRNHPHPYSYGYVNQQAFSSGATRDRAWMTIMAYDLQCRDEGYSRFGNGRFCQRLRNFSNSDLSLMGDALGVSGTTPSQVVTGPSNAARTLNASRMTIANFRASRAVSTGPDLAVVSPTVSDATLTPEQSFAFSATVRNEGGATAEATTLHYWYRPSGGSWTEVGSDPVAQLSASEASLESIRLTGPTQAGPYQYAACVASVSGESNAENNCSSPVEVTVSSVGNPDLVVESASVSDDTLTPGQSFTFSATVRNEGGATAEPTTLHYWYRPSGGSWTEVGSDPVGQLSTSGASEASFESVRLTAPAQTGTYQYAACVASVSGESNADNADNNCSIAVGVTVSSGGGGGGCTNDLGVVSGTVERTGSWTGSCLSVYYRGGEYARYYSFTLEESASVTIDLTSSSVDTWLVLYSGTGTGSEPLESDDDGGGDTNSRIRRQLVAGTYTIEATTFLGGVTGVFTLTLAVSQNVSEDGPDLVVQSPEISVSDLTTGQSFTFSATVRNQGVSASPAATLTYWWRPADGSWVAVGTDPVDGLSASGTSHEGISLTAPTHAGDYDYAACVSSVSGESDSNNNCSAVLRVTVGSGGTAAGCTNDLGSVSGTVTRNGSWTGACLSAHYSDGRYARYYSFTLSERASVTIDLTSPSADTWLALRSGSGTGSGLVDDNDDGGTGTNSRIIRTLTAGTYTIEATTWLGGVTGPFTLTLVVATATASCTNDLGLVSGTVERNGSWTGACLSAHYSGGEYARYYSFTLSERASVTIDLMSPSADTWLALRSGSGTGSGLVDDNDDGGTGTNSRIMRTLTAGTYTIEATTWLGGVTGPFTLALVAATATASCTNDLGLVSGTVERHGSWTGACLSAHYSDGRYARYYSFTLSERASVTIDLTSPSADTWLALRSGSGTGSGLVDDNDDGGTGTNSRIMRTLTAGTYTSRRRRSWAA